jgi:hypothetical protein
MTWDVIVTDTLAESVYLSEVSSHAGSIAAGVANRKELKYQSLVITHTFIPLAFETLGPINSKGVAFLTSWVVASLLALETCEKLFLFQRLSLTVQCFNAIFFQGSFHSNLADFDS